MSVSTRKQLTDTDRKVICELQRSNRDLDQDKLTKLAAETIGKPALNRATVTWQCWGRWRDSASPIIGWSKAESQGSCSPFWWQHMIQCSVWHVVEQNAGESGKNASVTSLQSAAPQHHSILHSWIAPLNWCFNILSDHQQLWSSCKPDQDKAYDTLCSLQAWTFLPLQPLSVSTRTMISQMF